MCYCYKHKHELLDVFVCCLVFDSVGKLNVQISLPPITATLFELWTNRVLVKALTLQAHCVQPVEQL